MGVIARRCPQELIDKVTLQKIDLGNGRIVRIVNGALVRKLIYCDFALGGNWHRYPAFVPNGEWWIELLPSLEDMLHNLRHEMRETRKMDFKLPYLPAHNHAAKAEEKDRGGKQFQKIRYD